MFSRTFLSGVVQLNRILVGSVSFSRCSKEQVAFRECSAGLFHSRCNPKDLAFQMCSAKVQQEEFLQGGLQKDCSLQEMIRKTRHFSSDYTVGYVQRTCNSTVPFRNCSAEQTPSLTISFRKFLKDQSSYHLQ